MKRRKSADELMSPLLQDIEVKNIIAKKIAEMNLAETKNYSGLR
jgi:hypothetical protein